MATIIDFFLSLFGFLEKQEVSDVPGFDLRGPLHYKIGGAGGDPGKAGEITEVGFGEPPLRFGTTIAYGNLLDQREDANGNPLRICGPYLMPTGTAKKYKEGVPDPKGPGFVKNLKMQCELYRSQGHKLMEQDNPDDEHFDIEDILHGIEIAAEHGLGMVAKNPGLLSKGDATVYVANKNIFGIIVEKDAGTPDEMDALRKRAEKPLLPVWFVFFGDDHADARETANQIKLRGYKRMGVTYDKTKDNKGKYIEYGGDIVDVLLPVE